MAPRRSNYPQHAPVMRRTTCRRCGVDVDSVLDPDSGLHCVLDVAPVTNEALELAFESRLWIDKGPHIGWVPAWPSLGALASTRSAPRRTHRCEE